MNGFSSSNIREERESREKMSRKTKTDTRTRIDSQQILNKNERDKDNRRQKTGKWQCAFVIQQKRCSFGTSTKIKNFTIKTKRITKRERWMLPLPNAVIDGVDVVVVVGVAAIVGVE